MKIENLSTLQIHKLTQIQYERELDAGRIDKYALYLVPDDEEDLSNYYTKLEIDNRIEELSSDKQDKLTFDTTPTADSTNPITSGGVYTALRDIVLSGGGDGSGIQIHADYNQNDASQLDYIRNRPFYDTRRISYYSQAENPNPVSFHNTMLNMSFYKVSDLIPTRDEIFNDMQVVINGETQVFVEGGIQLETDDFIFVANNMYSLVFINKAGTLNFTYSGYPMSLEVSEAGVYYQRALNAGVPEGRIIEINVGDGELKQIDPKFIPANLDFNLSDYYTKTEIDSVLGNVESILDEISALVGE